MGIRHINERDAWVTNADGDIIGIQLHGRSEMVDLRNPVNADVNELTGGITKIWTGTQAQYDALTPADDTLYIITPAA